jgi:hypothetical protein
MRQYVPMWTAHDAPNHDLLADGAPWIWNLKVDHMPRARETVTTWHARSGD